MSDVEDIAAECADLLDLIATAIGAWNEFGYREPPTAESAVIPPLGERKATAITAGHAAISSIDQLTRKVGTLRAKLLSELRVDSEVRALRADALISEMKAHTKGEN